MGPGAENNSGNKVRIGRIVDRPAWVRHLALLTRAVHQFGAAVVLAAYLLDVFPGPPLGFLVLALASGGVLLIADWTQHRQFFQEWVGVITLLKVLAFGAAYHGYLPMVVTVCLVFFAASLIAHAPKKTRHRLLF